MLEHGGKLRHAAQQYNIPLAQWMDLSTGLNPQAWPVCEIPASAWLRLPEEEDGLSEIAGQYYGAENCLAIAGSQAAIQTLPQLYAKQKNHYRVGLLAPAYAEHAHAWQQAGFNSVALSINNIETHLDQIDILLIVNPNNPTGHLFSPTQLLEWHQQLASRGGSLIVDEAFMDATPKNSLAAYSHHEKLIVLRSMGKFFGLAGARVGFVLAAKNTLNQLADILGPWPISGASRIIALAALQDVKWHQHSRRYLQQQGQQLHDLLSKQGLTPTGGTALFQWLQTPQAASIHQQFAKQGILTRLFSEPISLRFGLPANDTQWQRLELALLQLSDNDTGSATPIRFARQ
ncbi:L-threonine 3-O-phosphate decarboxylase [hydrothermal vent metagenome]|uniref:threonine-phosphate decarboxylase n=1 Tax=hydrothermal vent metagenome TaxID=652676 RepID=A0A3B1BD98_9ZZZZ